MEELNFSEEASIERYVNFTCGDQSDERNWHIDGIEDDDPIINSLQTYGSIATDWVIYEAGKSAVAKLDSLQFEKAA